MNVALLLAAANDTETNPPPRGEIVIGLWIEEDGSGSLKECVLDNPFIDAPYWATISLDRDGGNDYDSCARAPNKWLPTTFTV